MVIRSTLYAVNIRFYDPNCSHFRSEMASPFRPAFIPDNSIISGVCAPRVVEFPLCLSGQQFSINDF